MDDDPLHQLAQDPRRIAVTFRHIALHETAQLFDGVQIASHGSGMEFDGADRTRVQGVELRLKLRFLGPGLLAGAIDADRVPKPSQEEIGYAIEFSVDLQKLAFQAHALIYRVRSETPSLLLISL